MTGDASLLTPEMRALHGERVAASRAEDRAKVKAVELDNFLDRWLPQAAPYIDQCPHTGIAPSALMGIRYCALMSGGYTNAEVAKCEAEARRMADLWRIESRRRYRNGFYANPLGEPVERPK